MFDSFLYCLIPVTILAGAVGTYYIYYPRKVNNIAVNFSWNISRMYVECLEISETIGKIINNLDDICDECGYLADSEGCSNGETDEETDEEPVESIESVPVKSKLSLIYYNNKTETCFLSDSIDDVIVEDMLGKSPSIIFIKSDSNGKLFYKRTTEPNQDDIIEPFQENPFLQVEYIIKSDNAFDGVDTIHDIHQYLSGFYINGNTILDRTFLEWYLSYYYDISCAKEYILRIIDKDIKMFEMSSDKKVVLDDNTYVVTDIPTINISCEAES